ncbi:MAG TPA: hypothetical protein VGJ97_06400, partial [Anaerolineaceae bacterium]
LGGTACRPTQTPLNLPASGQKRQDAMALSESVKITSRQEDVHAERVSGDWMAIIAIATLKMVLRILKSNVQSG